METARPEYEFLDLSDVKEAELSRLECALFERPAYTPAGAQHRLAWAEPHHELSSCSSSTGGAATVSSSLDSLSGGECDMAPHSPQRSAPPAAPPPPYVQPPPPPPYTHPHPHPPPPPHHHQQWPVVPPNVYVSQVTANVNVHGYMGQYYQPPQSQYGPPPQAGDRQPRGTHRRERRGKRGPSPPPPQPPPYYVPYPQYYPAAQAQGAPLYHLPLYQPVTYMGPYPYASYYPEYPMPVEEGEKGPDEQYPQEMLMEQEAVDAYFAGAHYAPGPPYGPQPDGALEYAPPVYLPPPPPHQPLYAPHPPPHYQPTPHQFNVHAKNFVQNQNQAKSFTPPEVKAQEQKPPAAVPIASVSVAVVDALPVTDLKISPKEPASPKIVPTAPTESPQAKGSPTANNDKGFPKIQAQPEPPKPAQIVPETKQEIPSQIVKNFPSTGPPTALPTVATKVPPNTSKITKGPAAPFTGGKALPKTAPIPQTAIPTQQPIPTPKAPFANRQRRDGPATRSPDNGAETIDRNPPVVEHPKREPPLPPSKAPMPISISLSSQGGAPLIVSNKSPFAHSRKAALVATPEPPPTPQPPPPAPTASDFPPPPTPRNRGEPTPTPTQVQQQPAPASGKSWASLFAGNKSLGISVSSVSLPAATLIQDDPPIIPSVAAPTPAQNVQKPVAKVPPYDASPLPQAVVMEKNVPSPRPLVSVPLATPVISYSEKTSASVVAVVPKPASPAQPPPAAPAAPLTPAAPAPAPPVAAPEMREVPIVKETAPATPVQPSPFADDPNSYRMGEFLSKYSLDNRTVSLLPRGLTNRSNFCYVNAILQALIACAPFYNMLKALPYQTRRGKSSTPVIDAMVELCYEFTPLASAGRGARARGAEGAAGAALPVPTGAPLDPAAAHKVLRALRPFAGAHEGRQEDAEEFLGCLLNGLDDEMLELMKLVEPDEPKEAPTNGMIVPEPAVEEDDDDDEWKVMGPKNKGSVERSWGAGRTPLSDIFRGRTRCRLHRAPGAAHHVTDAVQPFFTLQLDIERASSVKEALELLAGRDQLEGVTAAAGGRVVVDAWQQLSLETLPVVLLLHLKCFQLDGDGHTAKIVKSVDFPIDLKIDPKIMSAKVKYNTRQRMYKLYAVVYHEGVEAVKGHYLTDALHGQAGWMRYDDSTVTLVSEAQVLKPKAPRMPYLLMYRRQDTLPAPPAHTAHPAPHRPPSKQQD